VTVLRVWRGSVLPPDSALPHDQQKRARPSFSSPHRGQADMARV
jgi:hypothetical protein